MRRKILVLNPHTYGHEAALKFIRKMEWSISDCEIVFCGSHANILKQLSEGPAYAVVPVFNTIVKEIGEVARGLVHWRALGFDFELVQELKLKVDHCLIAPQHVESIGQLTRVISHQEAVKQCLVFLEEQGITRAMCTTKDAKGFYSTGDAAQKVSQVSSRIMIGAIASEEAAKAYGLKVLARKIQDTPENFTDFQLLQNKSLVKPVTVGIIGYNGRFGRLFQTFFRSLGCTVIGADRKVPTELTNAEVVKNSDVVIFAIPIRRTVKAIRALLRYSRPDQLWIDITSVKQPAINAMLSGKAQVLGLHPMFAPEVQFEGQTIVVCPARLELPHWKMWAVNMLTTTGAKLKWSEGLSHDSYMATVQSSPHLANLVNAVLIMEMGISTQESLTFTSPFYRVMFSLMGRLLNGDPEMYASIIMQNPATIPMMEKRIKIEKRFLRIIKRRDWKGFQQLFLKAREHFSHEVVLDADRLFQRLIAVTKTLHAKNMVILEFSKIHDQFGLLEKVGRAFRLRAINITGFQSVKFDDHHIQFVISFSHSRDSVHVRQALQEIQSWDIPRVKVVS